MTDEPPMLTNFGGGQNWDQNLTGAGVLDGMAQTVKSIQNGDGLSIAANGLSAVIDTLGFVENPVKALGVTAIGWIIEHLTVLDAFLDRTTGDPGAVQNAAETFYKAAQDLDGIAADQIRSFGIDVHTYRSGQSPSAVEFEQRIGPRSDELKALSLQCLGLGETMNVAGLLVATCRGIMRDILIEFTYWVFKKGVIALAAAPYTGGSSLAALLTDTCIYSGKVAKKLVDKLGALTTDLKGLDGQLGKILANVLDKMELLAKPLGDSFGHAAAVSLGRNFAAAGAKTRDDWTSLSAANDAEFEVEAHEAAERMKDPSVPLWPPPQPEPITPLPPPAKPQGPGLGARWTTSGTLDE
jgi:hypothetical protein